MIERRVSFILVMLVWSSCPGCEAASYVMGSTWHEKFGWKAEDYFEDPKVIALCRAIEANDIAEIDRLMTAGANVNAKGKGNMTPLLWAFPGNKLERFKRLLEHGADPNVIIESDFGTRGAVMPGDSVTHLACKSAFPGYFDAVFAHGGDPNLVNSGKGLFDDTPLFTVIKWGGANKKEKIRLLLKKGADLNYVNGGSMTPVMAAAGWGGQYDVALMLLDAGADHRIYKPKSNSRLIHVLISEQDRRSPLWTAQQRLDFERLMTWLTDRGESIEKAREDNERWKSWNQASGEYRRKMDAEIAKRQAREQAAAEEKKRE